MAKTKQRLDAALVVSLAEESRQWMIGRVFLPRDETAEPETEQEALARAWDQREVLETMVIQIEDETAIWAQALGTETGLRHAELVRDCLQKTAGNSLLPYPLVTQTGPARYQLSWDLDPRPRAS